MNDCLFCKIIRGDIPSRKVYEDADTYAFLDINPVNPGHTLVIPKIHATDMFDAEDSDWRALTGAVRIVAHAIEKGLSPDGVNIAMNNRAPAGQTVFHAHMHVIPRYEKDGFAPWPGTPYKEGEADAVLERIVSAL
jgi:histidine triad (HIT) family protein